MKICEKMASLTSIAEQFNELCMELTPDILGRCKYYYFTFSDENFILLRLGVKQSLYNHL